MNMTDILVSPRQGSQGLRGGANPPRVRFLAWLGRVLTVLAALMTAWCTPLAGADTVTVCAGGECDYMTVQAAIDAESTDAGDVISILDSVHTEAGIRVDKSVVIIGAGASKTLVQAGGGPNVAVNRVFTVGSGASVTIRDMTIRYGKVVSHPGRGGGILNNGTLTLERSTVTQNRAIGADGSPGGTGSGGGIYNNGSMIILASTIRDNTAGGGDGSSGDADGGDAHGGGIASSENGSLVILNSTISGNTALHGAGYG